MRADISHYAYGKIYSERVRYIYNVYMCVSESTVVLSM